MSAVRSNIASTIVGYRQLFPLALISALVFSLPLAHTPALRKVLAGILAILLVISLLRRINITLPSPWMGAWALVCALSPLSSVLPAQSLSEAAWNSVIPMACGLMAMRHLDRKRMVACMAVPLSAGFAFVLAAHWLQEYSPGLAGHGIQPFLGMEGFFEYWPGRGVASTLAILAIPLAAWLLASGKRGWGTVLLLTALVLGAQNWNRMFWIAVPVTLFPCLFMFRLSRAGYAAVMLAAAVLAAIGFAYAMSRHAVGNEDMKSVTERNVLEDPRWRLWSDWKNVAVERPWLGHGLGYRVMQKISAERRPQDPNSEIASGFNYEHGHNLLLNLSVQVGGIGLFVFCAMLVDFLWRFVQCARAREGAARSAGLAGVALIMGMLAKNMTDDFMNFAPPILFWLLLGAFAGLAGLPARRDANR